MDHHSALLAKYRFGEYEIVRVLGAGGFGITYLGYDHHLDKPVAIKEYLPNDLAVRLGNTEVVAKTSNDAEDYKWGLDRFLEEARVLAKFDHPNLPKVYRFFEAHGTAYIVMEYAEGATLSQLIKQRGSISEEEVIQILVPLMRGLQQVHKAGYLHRDIKPGNIILRDDGNPMLLDFGSARAAIGGKSRSVTSIVTPGYAPIEQYNTKGNQGPWTDIYAVAAVAYKLVTGETPDDATGRLRNDPLVKLSDMNSLKVSYQFARAVDDGLEVYEEDRPQIMSKWMRNFSPKSKEPIGEREPQQEGQQPARVEVALKDDGQESIKAQTQIPQVQEELASSTVGSSADYDEYKGLRVAAVTFFVVVTVPFTYWLFRQYAEPEAKTPEVVSGKTQIEVWAEVSEIDSISSYKKFMTRFPKSKLSKLAKVKIDERELDFEAWDEAKRIDTKEAFQNYLDEQPFGLFLDVAKAKMQSKGG